MFTGLITAIGHITQVIPLGSSSAHGVRLLISAPASYLDDVGLGDSIAINGACMTVINLPVDDRLSFEVEVSRVSLETTAGLERLGAVHLEKAMRLDTRLGGHIVTGHIDGLARLVETQSVGESRHMVFAAPLAFAPYLAAKGSVALQGVSLTINEVEDKPDASLIHINLIDHTLHHTTFGALAIGDSVNLEIDLMARYAERILQSKQ